MERSIASLFILFLRIKQICNSGIPPTGFKGLLPSAGRCGSLTFNDEFWMFEWYLRGYQQYPLDMNVVPAWKDCYNGTGVVIAVVDGGVYKNNVDLRDQFINRLSYDPDPYEHHDLKHGTRIAGIIAAKENNYRFGVGIAFGAKLADVRLIINHPTADTEAKALTQGLRDIDIYSCAFNHFPSGFKTYPLDNQIEKALFTGTHMGRNYKGSIYVWSTGNGGENFFRDSCAFEGYNNNIYVISVAGVDNNLKKLPTGEQCSAIMVSGFSRDPHDEYATMITTDGDISTNNFGRNSAAVALISGAISLALQANPNLGYRDVMHLLTISSRNDLYYQQHNSQHNFSPNDFETNYANFRVSETFGFGLLDVSLMVQNALRWQNVGGRLEKSYTHNITSQGVSCIFVQNDCPIRYLEHVEVDMHINSPNAGHLKVYLKSMNFGKRTSSKLLPGRALDNSNHIDVKVMTVKFWGENPRQNQWCLYFDQDQVQQVSSHFWKLTLHGTADNPIHQSHFTSAFG